jgi:hypothetical protein
MFVAFCIFATYRRKKAYAVENGDVAQLARALDWQSRGRRFEPDLLHSFSEKTRKE